MIDPLDPLLNAIRKHAEVNPDLIISFGPGENLIIENDIGTELFLIEEGSVRIVVNANGVDKQVGIRKAGSIVGESGFLNHNLPRTATVRATEHGTKTIRLSRDDVFAILGSDTSVEASARHLWDLEKVRRIESKSISQGSTLVEIRLISAIIADIHGFSRLSAQTNGEYVDKFLFEFIENCHDLAIDYRGIFEDQGDGFKITFDHSRMTEEAVSFSKVVLRKFRELRDEWSIYSPNFVRVGLGIGLVTDFMTKRTRAYNTKTSTRISSHSLNIASFLAKHRSRPWDISLILDSASINRQKVISMNDTREIDLYFDDLDHGGAYFEFKEHTQNKIINYEDDINHSEGSKGIAPSSRVFLCHNSSDKPFVRDLNEALSQCEIETWFDEKNVPPGGVWQDVLSSEIETVCGCIVFFGPNGLGPWQDLEMKQLLMQFVERGCFIIPVVVGDDVNASIDVPLFFKNFQVTDLRVNPMFGFMKISREIEGHLARQKSGLENEAIGLSWRPE